MVNIHTVSQSYYVAEKLQDVLTDWEKIAGSVDHHAFLEETEIVADIAEAAARRNGRPVRVLDIGCGTGFFWKYLHTSYLPAEVRCECWLLDCSPYSLEACAETIAKSSNGKGVVSGKLSINAENLHTVPQLQGLQFDLIISLHSLYTVELGEVAKFGKTVAGLLAPGGKYWDLHYTASVDSFAAEIDRFYCSLNKGKVPYVMAESFLSQLETAMPGIKVQELSYCQVVHRNEKGALASYLQKHTFDDSFTEDTALPLISKYVDGEGNYKFPCKAHAISWVK